MRELNTWVSQQHILRSPYYAMVYVCIVWAANTTVHEQHTTVPHTHTHRHGRRVCTLWARSWHVHVVPYNVLHTVHSERSKTHVWVTRTNMSFLRLVWLCALARSQTTQLSGQCRDVRPFHIRTYATVDIFDYYFPTECHRIITGNSANNTVEVN